MKTRFISYLSARVIVLLIKAYELELLKKSWEFQVNLFLKIVLQILFSLTAIRYFAVLAMLRKLVKTSRRKEHEKL